MKDKTFFCYNISMLSLVIDKLHELMSDTKMQKSESMFLYEILEDGKGEEYSERIKDFYDCLEDWANDSVELLTVCERLVQSIHSFYCDSDSKCELLYIRGGESDRAGKEHSQGEQKFIHDSDMA